MSFDATIKVEPQALLAQASEVTSLIGEVKKDFDELEKIMSATQGYWIGDAGNLYRQQYVNKKDVIEEMLKRLAEHPRDLQDIAADYTATEQAVTQIADSLMQNIIE